MNTMSFYERRPLADLREAADNPRQITDERFAALKAALKADPDMLEARPLIAMPDGEVICGNMRLRALKELGWSDAPVYTADLDPVRRREWLLRDNNEYGDWVPDELGALIAAHQADGGDLALLGFTEKSTEALLTAHADGDGEAPVVTDPTTSAPEVWGLVIELDSEDEQSQLLEELAERGFDVRALIP
jgi:ParB-like chromosome segregation protein Spo0J